MTFRSWALRAIVTGSLLCTLARAADPATQPATRPASRPTSAPATLDIDLKTRAADPTKDPLPFVPGSWTLAVIPDTQNYNDDVTRPKYPKQQAMLQWVVLHKAARNIRFVTTVGDITNRNVPHQWEGARLAFSPLDGQLPYAMVTGNHDYTGNRTRMNEYFKASDNPLNDPSQGGALGGTMDKDALENAWYTFTANKQSYLLITVEYFPRDAALEWADKVIAAHKDKRVIFVTHSYLYNDDTRYDYATKGKKQTWNGSAPGRNDGEMIWQKLIRKHPNIIFTINGHVLGDALGYLASKGDNGNTVHQLLYNRQHKDDGQFRILEFLPDNKTVHVKTYSPVTDQWARDIQNEYILDLAPAEGGPASRPSARP